MPVLPDRSLNIQKHVAPVLSGLGFVVEQGGACIGVRKEPTEPYVMLAVCNSDELLVKHWGNGKTADEIAQVLVHECKSHGEELTIHMSEGEPEYATF